jgi:hypothetical protein
MSMRWLAAIAMTLASIGALADEARAVLRELTGRPVVYQLSNGEVRHAAMVVAGQSYTLPLEVETGANDTATFELANSVIDVAANSMVRIVAPEQGATNVVQRVLQAAGSALFHVRRGTVERFQVETPFLVSVVKGTVFNVLVRDDGATVSLQEGRLEVTSVDARQTVDLLPGDVAFAGHDGVLRVLDVQLTDHDVRVRAAPTPLVADDEVASQVVAIANVDIEAARTMAPGVPAADTIVKNIAEPTLGIVNPVGGVLPGIASDSVAPVVATTASVVTPVVDNVVAPVIGSVVTPVIDAVVAPVVAPVVETVVAPVVEAVVAPVVGLVAPVVEPVVAPLVDAVVEPVIVPVIDGIADPVAAALDPVVPDAVTTTVDTVVTPVLEPIAPVLDPLLPDAPAGGDTAPSGGLLGGLLGKLH